MTNKTFVITTNSDQQHQDWIKGQKGYIDGYVRGGNDVPLAAVIINNKIILIPPHYLEVIPEVSAFEELRDEKLNKILCDNCEDVAVEEHGDWCDKCRNLR